jgi:hypothetical protein
MFPGDSGDFTERQKRRRPVLEYLESCRHQDCSVGDIKIFDDLGVLSWFRQTGQDNSPLSPGALNLAHGAVAQKKLTNSSQRLKRLDKGNLDRAQAD